MFENAALLNRVGITLKDQTSSVVFTLANASFPVIRGASVATQYTVIVHRWHQQMFLEIFKQQLNL